VIDSFAGDSCKRGPSEGPDLQEVGAGGGTRTRKGRSPMVFETIAFSDISPSRLEVSQSLASCHILRPTTQSSLATSAARAIEMFLSFIRRHLTPNRSQASQKIFRMSEEALVN
jgi:hypothetical protein